MSQQQFEFYNAASSSHINHGEDTELYEPGAQSREQNEIYQTSNPTDIRQVDSGPGQKIYPQRPRRRSLRVVAILVLVLLLLGGTGFIFSAKAGDQVTHLPQKTFTVSAQPTLVIQNAVGTVTIHTGASNSVTVDASKHTTLFDNPNDIAIDLVQHGNEIDVNMHENNGFLFGTGERVDLNITLPATSDIQANVNAGSIDINGVTGKMNITGNAGTIKVENSTLTDQSSLHANAGSITFQGDITPRGSYDFQANAGTIDLTLPANSSFTLDARTNAGTINNEFGSDSVGSDPTTIIHAHANAGSINIHKG